MKKVERFIYRRCGVCGREVEVRVASSKKLAWFRKHGDKDGSLCKGSLRKIDL